MTTLPSINLLNNHSNNFNETTIVTAIALAFIILALAAFLGILLLRKMQCKRCSSRQSEEDPRQFTEVFVGDFVPHTVSEVDDTAGASRYATTPAISVHPSQINSGMTDKSNGSHRNALGKLQHNNLDDEIGDNIIYQDFESSNIYSEAGAFDVYPEAGTLNVYPKVEPLNGYTESGSLNVYWGVEPDGIQQDLVQSNINPYHNIDGYDEARIADTDDADSHLTIESDNNDDPDNIYVNANKARESTSSESDPFPETADDDADPITSVYDDPDPSSSVYDVPPNNSLYKTSFA